jgi:hypothetical protein
MSGNPELAVLRKENQRLRGEVARLRAKLQGLLKRPEDVWPERILEAQRTGFAFGVAHGMQESIKAVRDGVASLNLAKMIAGGINTLNTVGSKEPEAAPKPKAKKGARKP